MTQLRSNSSTDGAPAADAENVAASSLEAKTTGVRSGNSTAAGTHSKTAGLGRCRIGKAVWWASFAATWCGALSLLALALLRIFYHDGTHLLTCINAFTLYAYLPAYAVLAWAVWQRRWALTAASGFIVVCHLIWIAPDFTPARATERSSAGGMDSPAVKILYANVSAFNAEHLDLLAEVAREDPDVIVFVEYRRWWQGVVMSLPFVKKYEYGTGISEDFLGEVAVFSKLPITNVERHWPTGRQICAVDLQVENSPLRLFCLHSPRPMKLSGHQYFKYWEQTVPLIEAQTGPVVVLGDFNATQHSKVYRELVAGKMRSAHVNRGRGYATSWPNGRYPAPPIRIDHALVSPEIECLDVREGEGRGSDHKPLIVEIRVR